jgi:hypothetical protein
MEKKTRKEVSDMAKTTSIVIRVSDFEKDIIIALANSRGLTVSALLRSLAIVEFCKSIEDKNGENL